MRSLRVNQQAEGGAEDGAVAVIVALFFAFVVLGVAALTIDLGGLWSTQRGLVIDSDSMALAGALRLAEEEICDENDPDLRDAVEATVLEYAAANGADPDLLDDPIADITCASTGRGGIVQVGATEFSPGFFSGDTDLSARQTTAAEFVLDSIFETTESDEPVPVQTSLAFCKDLLPEPTEGGTTTYLPYNTPGGIPDPDDEDYDWYGFDGASLCPVNTVSGFSGSPTLPGGWGWIGGPGDCGDDQTETIPLDSFATGTPGNACIQSWVVENGDDFRFPIFDEARGTGGGEWRIVGWGAARLVGCSGSGGQTPTPPFNGNCQGNPRWLEIEVTDIRIGEDADDGTDSTRFEVFSTRELSICSVTDGIARCQTQ